MNDLKPKILYHASQNRNIEEFEPRRVSVRDINEGPRVFATEDLSYAVKFLVPSDDSWAQLSRWGKAHVAIYSDQDRFEKSDKGGSVYELPSDTFIIDPKFTKSTKEWTSKVPVKPIKKTDYESGLEAMIDNGVQIYFVDKDTFQKIKDSNDHGNAIVRRLRSANQERNKNVIEVPDMHGND